jgi:hypothetical protein
MAETDAKHGALDPALLGLCSPRLSSSVHPPTLLFVRLAPIHSLRTPYGWQEHGMSEYHGLRGRGQELLIRGWKAETISDKRSFLSRPLSSTIVRSEVAKLTCCLVTPTVRGRRRGIVQHSTVLLAKSRRRHSF